MSEHLSQLRFQSEGVRQLAGLLGVGWDQASPPRLFHALPVYRSLGQGALSSHGACTNVDNAVKEEYRLRSATSSRKIIRSVDFLERFELILNLRVPDC